MNVIMVMMMDLSSHQRWIDEISVIIDEDNIDNVVKFALSYTLQSLRCNKDEVFTKFKWKV